MHLPTLGIRATRCCGVAFSLILLAATPVCQEGPPIGKPQQPRKAAPARRYAVLRVVTIRRLADPTLEAHDAAGLVVVVRTIVLP